MSITLIDRWRRCAALWVVLAVWPCATLASGQDRPVPASHHSGLDARNVGLATVCESKRERTRKKRGKQTKTQRDDAGARRQERSERVGERSRERAGNSSKKSPKIERASEQEASRTSTEAFAPAPQQTESARLPAASELPDDDSPIQQDEQETESDTPIAREPDCSTPDAEPCPDRAVTATLTAYAGFTTRGIKLPTISGLTRFETGILPSLALQLGVQSTGDPFYAVTLNYQSSLGAEAIQAASDPQKPALSTSIHSHHFDAGVSGGLRLGAGPESASLGLFVGYGVRALATVIELRIPRYSLHGPVARLEFELPLGTPRVVLRLAPEAQWIVFISRDLENFGVAGPIWAFGGEASLRVNVLSRVSLQVAFRESHAIVASPYGASFEDVERFGLLGLIVHYL